MYLHFLYERPISQKKITVTGLIDRILKRTSPKQS